MGDVGGGKGGGRGEGGPRPIMGHGLWKGGEPRN